MSFSWEGRVGVFQRLFHKTLWKSTRLVGLLHLSLSILTNEPRPGSELKHGITDPPCSFNGWHVPLKGFDLCQLAQRPDARAVPSGSIDKAAPCLASYAPQSPPALHSRFFPTQHLLVPQPRAHNALPHLPAIKSSGCNVDQRAWSHLRADPPSNHHSDTDTNVLGPVAHSTGSRQMQALGLCNMDPVVCATSSWGWRTSPETLY